VDAEAAKAIRRLNEAGSFVSSSPNSPRGARPDFSDEINVLHGLDASELAARGGHQRRQQVLPRTIPGTVAAILGLITGETLPGMINDMMAPGRCGRRQLCHR